MARARNLPTAKLDIDLFKDFANRKLNITKNALHTIISLTPQVDYDGRVCLDMESTRNDVESIENYEESTRKKLQLRRRTFRKALDELCNTTYKNKPLLRYENGYYISGFHVLSNGDITYQRILPVLRSGEFRNLTLNQTRLFLYVLNSNIYNTRRTVKIENLYDNKLHDGESGLRVHESYRKLTDDLFALNDGGFINVCVQRENSELLDLEASNNEHKKTFHKYYGVTIEEIEGNRIRRKSRTSKDRKNNHTIKLKVTDELFKVDSVHNNANRIEFSSLAKRYQMDYHDFKEETINYFIGKKNELYEKFKCDGLEIYRTMLEKYFERHMSDVLYYEQIGKSVNYFSDFYLLKEIKNVICDALKLATGEVQTTLTANTRIDGKYIPGLIQYFIANASLEQRVLIDKDIQLIEKAHELVDQESKSASEPWTSLQSSIDEVYHQFVPVVRNMIRSACEEEGVTASDGIFAQLDTTIDKKEFIIYLAEKSLLSKQDGIEAEAERFKEAVVFLKRKQVPLTVPEDNALEERKERPLHLYYNWLIEGE